MIIFGIFYLNLKDFFFKDIVVYTKKSGDVPIIISFTKKNREERHRKRASSKSQLRFDKKKL